MTKSEQVMSATLANGAAMTPETWADFVTRLHHDCVGRGVDDHCTADAIFTVEYRQIVSGFDPEYTDNKLVYCDGSDWKSPQEYWDAKDDDETRANLNKLAQRDYDSDFMELDESEQWEILGSLPEHSVTGWREEWTHLNSHFTKDAAEAFIARKKHDYREGMRVYVESQYYAWEFNTIKKAILSGHLVYSNPAAQPVPPTAQEPRTEAQIVALAYTLSSCKYCPERSGEVAFKYDQLQAFALAIAQPVHIDVDELAQEIRRLNGNNELGAGALAEALGPFLSAHSVPETPRINALHKELASAKSLLVDVYSMLPEQAIAARQAIDKRTGPWFVWGVDQSNSTNITQPVQPLAEIPQAVSDAHDQLDRCPLNNLHDNYAHASNALKNIFAANISQPVPPLVIVKGGAT